MTVGTRLMTNACQGNPQKGVALVNQTILDDYGGNLHQQLARR
jgi:hypothetical protein